jgi:hypothetical protein
MILRILVLLVVLGLAACSGSGTGETSGADLSAADTDGDSSGAGDAVVPPGDAGPELVDEMVPEPDLVSEVGPVPDASPEATLGDGGPEIPEPDAPADVMADPGNGSDDIGLGDVCTEDCSPTTPHFCVLTGVLGAEVSCPFVMAAIDGAAPKATGIQFKLTFPPESAAFVRFHDELCMQEPCTPWDIPPQTIIVPTGHTVAHLQPSAGELNVVIYHGSAPTTPVSTAVLNGGEVTGDGHVFDVVFSLKVDAPAGYPVPVEISDTKATDQDANPLPVEMIDGIFVTGTL